MDACAGGREERGSGSVARLRDPHGGSKARWIRRRTEEMIENNLSQAGCHTTLPSSFLVSYCTLAST